jgi:acyl carrier protein
MNITQTVLDFFDSRGGLPGTTQAEKLACAYLDAKIVDSMGIIDMVSHFEEAFDIRFDAEALQSQEFQTVGGLIHVIEQLRATTA